MHLEHARTQSTLHGAHLHAPHPALSSLTYTLTSEMHIHAHRHALHPHSKYAANTQQIHSTHTAHTNFSHTYHSRVAR